MGQQQILLIVLGSIVIGMAVLVGINVFAASAVNTNRDYVIYALLNLGSNAQAYYAKSVQLGGGSREFTGWVIPASFRNVNGSFVAQVFEQSVIIIGTGNEIVSGTDSVKVKLTVVANNYETEIIN